MKRSFFAALFVYLSFTAATAQIFPVDTANLNNAYKRLASEGHTAKTEMEFLDAYPTTWLEFYMTYTPVYDDGHQNMMCEMCSEHISTLFSLSCINDTVFCKKIVNLTVGMKDSGECTSVYQDYLVGYVLSQEELVLNYLSKLRKGHQMQFWQFCWSTVTECSRAEHFKELYNRNKNIYPELMEISRTAFEYFYDGINYPNLLPHKEEVYSRKFINRDYKLIYNDYEK